MVVTPASADREAACHWSAPPIRGCDLLLGPGNTGAGDGALTGCPEWDHNSWLLSSAGGTTRCRGDLSVTTKAGAMCVRAYLCQISSVE